MDSSILTGDWYKQFSRDHTFDQFFLSLIMHNVLVGTHGGTHSRDNASLRALLHQRDMFTPTSERPVFLDLGFGGGIPLIHAGAEGWQAYGIDLSHECLEVAGTRISNAIQQGYVQEGLVKMALGDFFPRDFDRFGRSLDDVLITLGDRISLDYQKYKNVLLRCGFAPVFRREIRDLKQTLSPTKPYEELGISLDEVDVFYHYQVERHDRIVRLFSERAKRGAFLLFNRSLNDKSKEYDNVKVVEEAGTDRGEGYILVLYQKVADKSTRNG